MTQAAVLAASGSPGTTTGFKNRIINGGMVISQRNGTSAVNNSNNTYCLDRWVMETGVDNKFTAAQSSTAPAGFSNSLLLTSSSAYSVPLGEYYGVAQKIEGFNTADLGWGTANAKTVTLSFWVYSSLTGTFAGSILNSALNRSYVFSYTVSSANTWTQASVTIPGDTSGTWIGATNGIGLKVFFSIGTGSGYSTTAGVWNGLGYLSATGAVSVVGTSGATFYITGVQLEVGTTATNFDFRSYGTELALCQRYYQKFKADGSYGPIGLPAWVRTNSTFVAAEQHVVTMRATPTGASLGVWYAGGNDATNYEIGTTSITVSGISVSGSSINFTNASGGAFSAGGACNPNSGPSNTGGFYLTAEL